MRIRAIIIALFAFVAGSADAQAPARRVALVIANDSYQGFAPLNNPRADATLIAQSLGRAGFAVTKRENLGFAEMSRSLGTFSATARGADIALIYYAGHGIEASGRNWLIPTDAALATDTDLRFQAIEATRLVDAAAEARARVVVLDACRDNPFLPRMRRTTLVTRASTEGLAAPSQADTPRGTLIMLSAAAGETATDGPAGQSSPFARAFARWLPEPGLELRLAAGRIADAVFDETGERQLPHYVSTLSGAPILLVAVRPATSAPDPELARLRQRVKELEDQGRPQSPVRPTTQTATSHPPTQSPQATAAPTMTARLANTLTGHTKGVHSIGFSADGRYLFSNSQDQTVRIWRRSDGTPMLTIAQPGCYTTAVDFTSDGSALIGYCGANVMLWPISAGGSAVRLTNAAGVRTAMLSPNGALLAVSVYGSSLGRPTSETRLIEVSRRRLIATLPGERWNLAFSRDSRYLLTGNLSGVVELYQMSAGAPQLVWSRSGLGAVSALAMAPERGVAFVGNQQGYVYLLNFTAGTTSETLPSLGGYVGKIAENGAGLFLTSVSRKDTRIWRVAGQQALATIPSAPAFGNRATFSPDGARIVTHESKAGTVLNAATGALLVSLPSPSGTVDATTISPDGRTVATAGSDGAIRMWVLN